MEFYSQYGQDKIVYDLFFKNKKNGTFVEIGASGASNCYFFEKNMGWRGLAIDGYKKLYEDIKKNRNCTVLHKILSDKEENDEFIEVKGYGHLYSGLISKMPEAQKLRIQRVLTKEDNKKENFGAKIKKVNTEKLSNVLDEFNLTHIDYLSIDTEGSEIEILSTVDFDKVNIDVISVEDNFKIPKYSKFFEEKGYFLVAEAHVDKIYSKIPVLN